MALLSAVQKSTGLLKVPIGFDRLATRGGLKPGHAVHVPNASTAARDGRGLEAGSRQRREIGSDGVKKQQGPKEQHAPWQPSLKSLDRITTRLDHVSAGASSGRKRIATSDNPSRGVKVHSISPFVVIKRNKHSS